MSEFFCFGCGKTKKADCIGGKTSTGRLTCISCAEKVKKNMSKTYKASMKGREFDASTEAHRLAVAKHAQKAWANGKLPPWAKQ